MTGTHTVTGAFGYTGSYIAEALLARGGTVMTLTNSASRQSPLSGIIEARPLCFDRPDELAASLRGTSVLYNTYWVRFNHSGFSFAGAVRNTLTLFDAARRAGVSRIVHVSIMNADSVRGLEYFEGKAALEKALALSGIPHAILRPAVIFGSEDILVNNIAWFLRRLPVFGVFGDGNYGICPVHVRDFAGAAVEAGASDGTFTRDITGPEKFTFRELVETIGEAIGEKKPVIRIQPHIAMGALKILGLAMNDVVLTWEEIKGLTCGSLWSESPPAGTIRLSQWARDNANTLGLVYASELLRRRNRDIAYAASCKNPDQQCAAAAPGR